MENWRDFLNENKNIGRIIFLSSNAAVIGVSHDKGPLKLQINEKTKQQLIPIAKLGFYFEGKGSDVPKLQAAMKQSGIPLGATLGQFDKYSEIKTDRINWAYTLFTGNKFESVEWPSMISKGENDGSISKDRMDAFKIKKNKTAADIIFLMLTSQEFGPKGLGGLNDQEAKQVLQILIKSGVKVNVPAKEILSVMKQAHLKLFPDSGDIEGNNPLGQLSKNVQEIRRKLLVSKLKATGGIGLIGYSHLVHFSQ